MNLDDMLLHQQYERDNRPLNEDKVYFLVVNNSILCFTDQYDLAAKEFEKQKQFYEEIEFGWVWDNDFKLNRTEEEEKKIIKLMNYAD